MDLFNNKANDEAVGYLHATIGVLERWLNRTSILLTATLFQIMSNGDGETADKVGLSLADALDNAASLIERVGVGTGECAIKLKDWKIEIIQYTEPHSLTQQDLMSRVLEMGTGVKDIVGQIAKCAEIATGTKAPDGFVQGVTDDLKELLDRAVASL